VKLKYEVSEYVLNVGTCSLILVSFHYKESNLFYFCIAWQVCMLPHELNINPLFVAQICMFLCLEITSVLEFHEVKTPEVSKVGRGTSPAICCRVYGLSVSRSKSSVCLIPE
jgi:hypothetical protein